ncbi:hypothetical protein [Peribacillus frigoritolerans]|uniref:hypothetical protein n=1 Tax=Peribacillus frigoritolerans TaxID=450367 RepID=UPI0020BD4E7A|nr:hypothetical protein [Peribacillus frigoritolerans]
MDFSCGRNSIDIGWKTEEAIKYQKEVYHFNQIDEEFVEFVKKAYVSGIKKQSPQTPLLRLVSSPI